VFVSFKQLTRSQPSNQTQNPKPQTQTHRYGFDEFLTVKAVCLGLNYSGGGGSGGDGESGGSGGGGKS
jgi:hypothetical protein